jgi:hypothetical protein
MKRFLLVLAPVLALATGGCVVRTAQPVVYEPYQPPPPVYQPPPPAPPPPVEVYYYGQHFLPDSEGGGWCYAEGPHTHAFAPDHDDWYEQDAGYWYYRGPLQFTYWAGHPVPGGGWCYISGPHSHEYYPPRGSEWFWRRGQGYVYQGPYRPERPPPAHYWPRPLPVPPRVPPRPGYEYRPSERPRAPDDRRDRDRTEPPRPGAWDRDHEQPRPPLPQPPNARPERPFPRPEPRPPVDDPDRNDHRRDPQPPGQRPPGQPPPGQPPVVTPPGRPGPGPAPAPGGGAVQGGVDRPRPGHLPRSGDPQVREPVREKEKPKDKAKDKKDDDDKKDDPKRPGRVAPAPFQRN